MATRRVPSSILATLGLLGCAPCHPCLSTVPAQDLPAAPSQPDDDPPVGPCLKVAPRAIDDGDDPPPEDSPVHACLTLRPHPCLAPPPPAEPPAHPCLAPPPPEDWPVHVCLSLPPPPVPSPEPAEKPQGSRTVTPAGAVAAVLARRVLPDDVAAVIRARSGGA